jgi:hypothetical protein
MEPILRPIKSSAPKTTNTASNILELPKELLEIIFSYVSVTNVQSIMLTCKRFNNISINSAFVQRSWYTQEYQILKEQYGGKKFQETNLSRFKRYESQQKAAEVFFNQSPNEVIKHDATIEEMQHESARMRRAQKIYQKNERDVCLKNWGWVLLPLTCCGCCGTICCMLCLYNKIRYDTCSLETPSLHQEAKKPLG